MFASQSRASTLSGSKSLFIGTSLSDLEKAFASRALPQSHWTVRKRRRSPLPASVNRIDPGHATSLRIVRPSAFQAAMSANAEENAPEISPGDGTPTAMNGHCTTYAQCVPETRTCVVEAGFRAHAHVGWESIETEKMLVMMTYPMPVRYVVSSTIWSNAVKNIFSVMTESQRWFLVQSSCIVRFTTALGFGLAVFWSKAWGSKRRAT